MSRDLSSDPGAALDQYVRKVTEGTPGEFSGRTSSHLHPNAGHAGRGAAACFPGLSPTLLPPAVLVPACASPSLIGVLDYSQGCQVVSGLFRLGVRRSARAKQALLQGQPPVCPLEPSMVSLVPGCPQAAHRCSLTHTQDLFTPPCVVISVSRAVMGGSAPHMGMCYYHQSSSLNFFFDQ